jgi:alkanesulfonate monooxygenase SsuD/methylene tetrahydromethanopterin reductase-like flavin-dependent oxidoreductase (luciferase family)
VRLRFAGPILVGGAGERVLLRLVAQHADACNLTDSFEPAFYRQKLDVLRRHCEELQRDYDSILRTATFTVSPDVGRSLLEPLAGAGISYFILYVDPPADIAALEQVAAELL